MAEKIKKDYDISNESLLIGSFYKKPDLYIEYGTNVRSKFDFKDSACKFFFDSFEVYYTTFSTEIEQDKVNIFMLKNEARKSLYQNYGGWSTVSKMMELSDPEDFANYYDTLKKYSLIRELGRKGFQTEKIMNYKGFDSMPAEKIMMLMRESLDRTQTIIGGGKDSLILGEHMVHRLKEWMETPDMGITLPFKSWNDLFRGLRKKKLIVDGMLSNEGKSRKMLYVASYLGILLGKKVLIMANEMDENDLHSALITTVCNNKEFGFGYKIPERNIVLNEYDSEEQRQQALEVADYIEKNTNIYFKDMEDYSDLAIEHEMRKHVLALGVEYVFYDTLKGHRTDNWEAVKQTCTRVRDLVKELDVGGYATIQLTDDSLNHEIFEFSSNNIANAKQLKHVVDFLVLEKQLPKSEYNRYKYVDEWGQRDNLAHLETLDYMFYGQKIDKNRGGAKGMTFCTSVNLDYNTWDEIGQIYND